MSKVVAHRRATPRPLRAGALWERLASTRSGARGSLLVAMLVTMTIGSIFLAMASSQWSFIIRRDREKELIHRGVQIAKAIEEWQQTAKAPPTSLEQMTKPPRPTLRKAWVDPMTARYDSDGKLVEGTGQWSIIGAGTPTGADLTRAPGASGSRLATGPSGATAGASGPSASAPTTGGEGRFGAPANVGPIVGVQSTSEELSIGTYGDTPPESPYTDWKFSGLRLNTTTHRSLEGGFEIPRPPGFAGFRLPGGPPLRELGATQGQPPPTRNLPGGPRR